jgi:hypothetical protein
MVASVNLLCISKLMTDAWTHSIAVDIGDDKGALGFLDIHVRVPAGKEGVEDLHVVCVPLSEVHTGKYMFDVVKRTMTAKDPMFLSNLCGVTTDGAASMVGAERGFATLLERAAVAPVLKVRCLAHQKNLVMGSAMDSFTGDGHGLSRGGALEYHDFLFQVPFVRHY